MGGSLEQPIMLFELYKRVQIRELGDWRIGGIQFKQMHPTIITTQPLQGAILARIHNTSGWSRLSIRMQRGQTTHFCIIKQRQNNSHNKNITRFNTK